MIQDRAYAAILDSYHDERWPVGRTLLRATDRLFGAFATSRSGSDLVRLVRRLLVRGVVAPALSRRGVRAVAFHFDTVVEVGPESLDRHFAVTRRRRRC